MNNQILYAIKSLEKRVVDLYSKLRNVTPSSSAPGLQEVLDVETYAEVDSGNSYADILGGNINNRWHDFTISNGLSSIDYQSTSIVSDSDNASLISVNGNETARIKATGGNVELHRQANEIGKKTVVTFNRPTQNTTLDFPAKSVAGTYTLATLDDIPSATGFVPYTGATNNLSLGTNSISLGSGNNGAKIIMNGNKGTNYIDIENAGDRIVYQMDSIVYTNKQFGGTKTLFLDTYATTGNNYNISLPNASGTVALTSDIPTLTSGTYTPTVASITNTSGGSTNRLSTYTRIGNIVSVKADVLITFTTALTESIFSITLPVPFSTAEGTQYVGSAISSASPYDSGFVQITTTTASVFMKPTNSGTARIVITFTYRAL